MTDSVETPFLQFLANGIESGGFETDDVLAAMLPLLKQVSALHQQNLVAPLIGVEHLYLGEQGELLFNPANASPVAKNLGQVESLQRPSSRGMEILGESRRTADLDQNSLKVADLSIGIVGEELTRPVYLPDYRSWEHAIGHHDQLTDIFSLGQLLASIACGLDFTNLQDLELFVSNRNNLFAIHRRLNPVLASVIVQMTELNRHKRAPDLSQIISRLENYREQTVAPDLSRSEAFKTSGLLGKRQLIQANLRDRLFEISRRNRLIYFKPTLHTLNLTVASVPLLLDYKNIKLEQLFVWHPQLAATITEGTPMSLGKYLRFEDAPYIPGLLDKIISEERRDRAEYGFAQLRLVICFLRWNNLKEAPDERINSPLLLLPVELTRKKGVRDNYVLDPTSTEAVVNPALRHHLKELYNLNLPELVDLKETSLDQFWDSLRSQIQASEPGVTLSKIDRPRIELIHEKARQRVDQYRRRMKVQPRRSSPSKPQYSYEREDFRPLGLQLFLEKVRPAPMPMRDTLGANPQPRLPHITQPLGSEIPDDSGNVLQSEQKTFALHQGESQNRYSWEFDLCNITLGNFNYRKMTLVRDYANLIETDLASAAFDSVFSLSGSPPEADAPPLPLGEQNLIISCDAAQASAITRARTGASYIIQGPPGTGKSQTITNLIADYVGRGKRVLFVCEKRAAIDVVFHRLRRQGLDELCCLIHDSQTDKKAFIQNLKQTSEQFLAQASEDADIEKIWAATLRAMESDLDSLRRYSEAMEQARPNTGLPLRALLHRLVQLRGRARDLAPETEELLPGYPLWLQHGETVDRISHAFVELGEDLCFARHPLHWLGREVLQADRPIETLGNLLDKAEDLLDSLENALEFSGLPDELWDTFEEIQAILQFAVQARPLADRSLLGTLVSATSPTGFDNLAAELELKSKALVDAKEKNSGWKEPISIDDTQNALEQARKFESSLFRILQPAYWRLKKTLQARYDFTRHAVPPSWSKILGDLFAEHQAQAALNQVRERARTEWHTDDPDALVDLVEQLRQQIPAAHPSVKGLLEQLAKSDSSNALIQSLADIQERFAELDATLATLLEEHDQFDFRELSEVFGRLREQSSTLAELSPVLGDFVELPEILSNALRQVELPLNEFEAAMGHKSVNQVYREDRAINRFEGRVLARKMDQLQKRYNEWLALNARRIRSGVRRKFLEHVRISSLPASQLDPDQKSFKKSYASGRRDLEHEFGKTMRYKSIRDLAAGDTGQVIQDLKPIWLMSPLSVSDTLPLDPTLFDVVIFDEASQIPLEEAIPAIYRSQQVIIVGDEMQLPPTTFFATSRNEDETVLLEEEGERIEMSLDSDSFLTQAAQNLPSTLLAWHYRSRYEALISFSNAAFYSGDLFTIPDRHRTLENQSEIKVTRVEQGDENVQQLLARSISFHAMENGVYENRTNPNEAAYIARLVRGLLALNNGLSIGIVAFSEAQQAELESALNELADEDAEFAGRFEAEMVREENDVFCGLFVKNLENVQGDERDIIIMSVCYGRDLNGRMLMNFGPINQRGGEKRLNVIFSRAKQHMAIVSSIRFDEITNDYNDGANSLKQFLQYAEAVSKGDAITARRVLENLNPLARNGLAPISREDAVVTGIAHALRERGFEIDLNVGQSRFRCDLAIRSKTENVYQLGILVDTEGHYANPNLLDRYVMQPSILRAFGWQVLFVLTKDWYHNPDDVISRIEKLLNHVESGDSEVNAAAETLEEAQASKPVAAGSNRVPDDKQSPEEVLALHTPAPNPNPAVRHFELISGTSRKFWEIFVNGSSLTVRYGRIGTDGITQTKSFADATKAAAESEKLILAKKKKGYAEV
ncbi:MAG: AAA domain-containing protein [Verrucomicrobiota bacterium]